MTRPKQDFSTIWISIHSVYLFHCALAARGNTKKTEVETTWLIDELLEFVDDVVDELDSRSEINYIKTICENGTGADRQLEVWEQSHDTKAVTEFIVEETYTGLNI